MRPVHCRDEKQRAGLAAKAPAAQRHSYSFQPAAKSPSVSGTMPSSEMRLGEVGHQHDRPAQVRDCLGDAIEPAQRVARGWSGSMRASPAARSAVS